MQTTHEWRGPELGKERRAFMLDTLESRRNLRAKPETVTLQPHPATMQMM